MTSPTLPLRRTVQARPGLDLHLHEAGQGSPVLVLRGGFGPGSRTPLVGHLTTHHRVVAPTHPGRDGTARPDELHSVPTLAALCLNPLAHLSLHDVTVLATSFGGWVAAQTVLDDHKGRISRPRPHEHHRPGRARSAGHRAHRAAAPGARAYGGGSAPQGGTDRAVDGRPTALRRTGHGRHRPAAPPLRRHPPGADDLGRQPPATDTIMGSFPESELGVGLGQGAGQSDGGTGEQRRQDPWHAGVPSTTSLRAADGGGFSSRSRAPCSR